MMDIWLESGMSHLAVLNSDYGLSWPASLCLEGIDQMRGWFRASLITAVTNQDKPPFNAVFVHGFILDGFGGKMSKSGENSIFPSELANRYGADVLRLWLAGVNCTENVSFSENALIETAEKYRFLRAFFDDILISLTEFSPDEHAVSYAEMAPWDKYLVIVWSDFLKEITDAYQVYAFHHVIRIVDRFIKEFFIPIYLKLSGLEQIEQIGKLKMKRSSQTGISVVTNELIRCLAPVLVFTSEELWYYLPGTTGSVLRQDFPTVMNPSDAESLRQYWYTILENDI